MKIAVTRALVSSWVKYSVSCREYMRRAASQAICRRSFEFFMEGVAMNDELLQADRIHPNTEAQPILLENAWPIISATLDDAL